MLVALMHLLYEACYGVTLLRLTSWIKEEQRGIGQGGQTRRREALTHSAYIQVICHTEKNTAMKSGKMLN